MIYPTNTGEYEGVTGCFLLEAALPLTFKDEGV